MTRISSSTADVSDVPLVLVLPFATGGGAEDEEGGERYLAEGISDELAFALTQLPSLRVVGRATADALRSESPAEGARLVSASLVVSGTVRASGEDLRIEVHLEATASPTRTGALRRTCDLGGFTVGVASLAEAVARFAGAEIPYHWRARDARPLAATREVVDLILRGRYHVEQRPIGVKLAMQCFDRAIRLDGAAAAPYGALGILWANFGLFLALPPAQARERAIEQAARALELDPHEANALAAQLTVSTFYDWNLARADALGALLLRWYPSWITPRQALLYAHAARGHEGAVRTLCREVQQLDPRAIDPINDAGFSLLLIGAAGEAVTLLEAHAELHPEASEVHRRLGLARLANGDASGAVKALEHSVNVSRRHAWGVANLACAYARAGRESDARRLLAELEERAEGEIVPSIALAEVHASLGDVERGLAALDRALEARDYWLLMIDRDPLLDSLRTDPRFSSFRARCTPILH